MVEPDAAPPPARGSLSPPVRARIVLSLAARDAAEYARALVPTSGDVHDQDGDPERRARRLRLHGLAVVAATVLVQRTRGQSWEQIGAGLGLAAAQVEQDYAEIVARWLAGEVVELGPALPDGVRAAGMPRLPQPTIDDAYALDAWFQATAGPRPNLPDPFGAAGAAVTGHLPR